MRADERARSRDDLVVSEANRLAVELIEAWPAWPSNVVSLSGPQGSGKTHLATLWREVSDAAVLDASQLSSVESVINGAVLLDDIDDTTIDETGLFHLFNAIRTFAASELVGCNDFVSLTIAGQILVLKQVSICLVLWRRFMEVWAETDANFCIAFSRSAPWRSIRSYLNQHTWRPAQEFP